MGVIAAIVVGLLLAAVARALGLSYRRRIRIAPGLHLNLGAKSASMSAGPRGLSMNVGRKGVRLWTGLPGTGLFAQSWLYRAESTQRAHFVDRDGGEVNISDCDRDMRSVIAAADDQQASEIRVVALALLPATVHACMFKLTLSRALHVLSSAPDEESHQFAATILLELYALDTMRSVSIQQARAALAQRSQRTLESDVENWATHRFDKYRHIGAVGFDRLTSDPRFQKFVDELIEWEMGRHVVPPAWWDDPLPSPVAPSPLVEPSGAAVAPSPPGLQHAYSPEAVQRRPAEQRPPNGA